MPSAPNSYSKTECSTCGRWFSNGAKICPHCRSANLDYLDRRAAYNNLGSAPPWRGKKDTVEDVLRERKKTMST